MAHTQVNLTNQLVVGHLVQLLRVAFVDGLAAGQGGLFQSSVPLQAAFQRRLVDWVGQQVRQGVQGGTDDGRVRVVQRVPQHQQQAVIEEVLAERLLEAAVVFAPLLSLQDPRQCPQRQHTLL